MNIGFIIWLILSATLLYFLGWDLLIRYRQKQAWKIYAAQKKLRYSSPQMFSSPEIGGVLEGHTLGLFTGEHIVADARGSRKLTAIEITLSSVMPFEGGVASAGMVTFLKKMNMHEEILPGHPGWNNSYIAATTNRAAFESYLTKERLDALTSIMKAKNVWTIMVFREKMSLLRLDTPDPLDKVEKIERTVKKLLDVARVLELKPGEGERLKTQAAQRPHKSSVALQEASGEAGLKLEEEMPSPENERPD
ncbi:MAG: hypothetical protein IT558_03270 [Alphaproteobacteria bacterium]|nr:hypothetical protein [Alphaproteobacteria bacterium]